MVASEGVTLFLCGDLLLGRGIDQVLLRASEPPPDLISKNVQLRERSMTGPISWPSSLTKNQGLSCLKMFLGVAPRLGD